jgi:multiple sugar transport system ATP-binding protein
LIALPEFAPDAFLVPMSRIDNRPGYGQNRGTIQMAQVQLRNISKAFPGGATAVDGVSLDIADGEFVVLVGPSGCGKSTTLRLIAGLESPDGGSIHIGPQDVTNVEPKDRDIAMVFQNYALYPHMTVRENLSFALRLRMLPPILLRLFRPSAAREIRRQIDARVDRAAEMLGLRDLMHRKPRQLSGGQRQRVALGRAMVREPAAFLFDEPLSNLDARLRVTTRAELKRLHQRLRTTTIYVTHDQEEAMTLGDRIVVMKDGRIQQSDTALVTYHRPANRFVAGFIGMPPMNFFDGTLQSAGGDLVFAAAPPDGRSSLRGDGAESADGLTAARKGFTLSLSRLPAAVRDRLAARIGSAVVLGIRPEHLSLHPIAGSGGQEESQRVEMVLQLIEPLGSEIDLYLQAVGSESVVARVDAAAGDAGQLPQVGSVMQVHVDLRRVHLFEPGETGMNLSLETSSSGPARVELAHAMA